MDWAKVEFPGAGSLRRRVTGDCARTSRGLDAHQFGTWLDRGDEAPPSIVDPIEQSLVACLDRAAGRGQRSGLLFGAAIGFGAGALLVILAWVVTR